MKARIPSPRSVRRAVDLLAQLGPDVLAHVAEAVLERLDAHTPDPEIEEDNEDACMAEDAVPPDGMALGDEDDAEEEDDLEPGFDNEPSLGWPAGVNGTQPVTSCDVADLERDHADDEPDDDDMGSAEEEPLFPLRRTELRAARDGLVTVHRRTFPVVVVTSTAGRPTGVATMLARRFP